MPVEVLIMFFGGLLGIGGIILAGQYLGRSGGSGQLQDAVKHLGDAVGDLQSDVRRMQDEVVELKGRIEFTERLLERPKGSGADAAESTE